MKIDTKIFKSKGFVGRTVSGEVDSTNAAIIAKEYVSLAYQYPDQNILVDLRDIKASMSIVNLMEVAQEIAGLFPGFTNKVAHLILDEDERVRLARQFESCMVLKGFNYKVFTDFDEAGGWLSKTP